MTETLLWELFLQAGPVGTLVRRCTVECVFVLLLECGLPDFNATCSHTVRGLGYERCAIGSVYDLIAIVVQFVG